jgi:hypothetical protein
VAGTELVWRPLRAALGARVAGIGGYTVERAGQEVVEGHSEAVDGRGHEELYIVLRGRARFGLDGEELDAPTGTFVLVRDPAVPRRAVAAEPDTAVVAVGGPPVFEPTGSEWVERARPHLRDDPERARVVLDELCRERPASPGLRLGEALLRRRRATPTRRGRRFGTGSRVSRGCGRSRATSRRWRRLSRSSSGRPRPSGEPDRAPRRVEREARRLADDGPTRVRVVPEVDRRPQPPLDCEAPGEADAAVVRDGADDVAAGREREAVEDPVVRMQAPEHALG